MLGRILGVRVGKTVVPRTKEVWNSGRQKQAVVGRGRGEKALGTLQEVLTVGKALTKKPGSMGSS